MRLLVSTITLSLLAGSALAQVAPQGALPPLQPSNTWAPAPAPASVPAPAPANTAQAQPADPLAPSAASAPAGPSRIQPGRELGLEQKAWQDPTKHMSKRQSRPGFIRYQWRPDDIMQINVREGLVSVVKFPSNEEIVQVISSDPATFETIIAPNKRSFVLRSAYAGVDGNVIAYGSSGNVYNFYVRALVFNASVLPDSTVEVAVGGMAANTGETVTSQVEPGTTGSSGAGYKGLFTPAVDRAVAHFDAGGREYARGAPINPDNMRANVIIKAQSAADSAIAPVRAWHDGRFTYLDFGPNASSMVQWPVAALVVQGVESPVGTRVTGRDRSMMVVEAVGNIVLRNGQYVVCLFAQFPRNDARYSVNPPLEAERAQPNAGIPIRAPAAAIDYGERARVLKAAADEDQRKQIAEAAARSRQAAADTKRNELAAKAAREREDRDLQRRQQAAEAERKRIEANTPPPPPGSLSATLGPISSQDGAAILKDLERRKGRAVKGLSVQWQNDRGQPVPASAAKGRVYLRVDGLNAALSTDLCSAARTRSAGCSTLR